MLTVFKSRGRGRPPTHPVDRVRTKVWFNAVKISSGLPSAYALEMAFDGDRVRKRAKDVARPRKWDRYAKGKSVPADKPDPRNAVEQAEAKFRGTARWFRIAMWRWLRGESLDAHEIDRALRSLGPEVVSILFEAPRCGETKEPRMREFYPESVRILSNVGGFDALVAAVLLVALSEVIASPQLRERALQLYAELQAPLRQTPELASVYPELFSLIDQRCKHWIYVTPNQRFEIIMPWQTTPIDVTERFPTRLEFPLLRKRNKD